MVEGPLDVVDKTACRFVAAGSMGHTGLNKTRKPFSLRFSNFGK